MSNIQTARVETGRDEDENSKLMEFAPEGRKNNKVAQGSKNNEHLSLDDSMETPAPNHHIVGGNEGEDNDSVDEQKAREKAKKEEEFELDKLLQKTQPPVPAGFDYLILPRKINIKRVPLPPTIIEDDYFKSVKALVNYLTNLNYF